MTPTEDMHRAAANIYNIHNQGADRHWEKQRVDLAAHITKHAAQQNSIALLGQRRQLLRALLLHDEHVDAMSIPALALA